MILAHYINLSNICLIKQEGPFTFGCDVMHWWIAPFHIWLRILLGNDVKHVAEEVQHLGGLHIKLNSHPFRSKLPRQDCHGSKSIDRFDSLKAFLGATATRKLTKLLGDAGVINSVPRTTRNRTQRRNIEDELAPLWRNQIPPTSTLKMKGQ